MHSTASGGVVQQKKRKKTKRRNKSIDEADVTFAARGDRARAEVGNADVCGAARERRPCTH